MEKVKVLKYLHVKKNNININADVAQLARAADL